MSKSIRPLHVLIKRTFSVGDAYRRRYVADHGSVSHRWEMPGEPDPDGVNYVAFLESLF